MTHKTRLVGGLIVGAFVILAALAGYGGAAAPIDGAMTIGVADAKTASFTPYNPSLAVKDANVNTRSITFPMTGYTGFVVRVRYSASATLITSPTVQSWGMKGGSWLALADAGETLAITPTANATTDCTDGTYKWTPPSRPIDALGSQTGAVTVSSAASSSGAVAIEITRF